MRNLLRLTTGCVLAALACMANGEGFALRLKNNSQATVQIETKRVGSDANCEAPPQGEIHVVQAGATIYLQCESMDGAVAYCIKGAGLAVSPSPWVKIACSSSPPGGVMELNMFGR